MTDDVLAWDDASNNRYLLSGRGSWIHNPISPYNAALTKKMDIAKDINHHPTPAGPAGRHNAPPIVSLGIWKFARNPDGAREFLRYLFEPDNFNKWGRRQHGFQPRPRARIRDAPDLGDRRKTEESCRWRVNTATRAAGRTTRTRRWRALTRSTSCRTWWRRRSAAKNVKAALQWGEDQIHRIMKNTRERRA